MNAHILRRQLLERGVGLQTSSDTEVMIHLLTGGSGDWMNRIKMLMAQAEGAFALTIITGDAVYGVRDPWGFRPLVLGKFEGGYLLASETCAFSAIGAELVHELCTGRNLPIGRRRLPHRARCGAQATRLCTFEQIYFSRPDSIYEGKLVHSTRQRLGRELAREAPVDADVVVAVPDSGTPHAVGSPRKRASRTPRDSPRTAMSGARSSSPPRSFASRKSE